MRVNSLASFVGEKKIYLTKTNGKRLFLGVVTKDKRFITFRKESHKFRMYDGWGFNVKLLFSLEAMDIKMVEIHTEKRILRIPLKLIEKVGIKYRNPKGQRDLQIIVPEKSFNIYNLPEKPSEDYEEKYA